MLQSRAAMKSVFWSDPCPALLQLVTSSSTPEIRLIGLSSWLSVFALCCGQSWSGTTLISQKMQDHVNGRMLSVVTGVWRRLMKAPHWRGTMSCSRAASLQYPVNVSILQIVRRPRAIGVLLSFCLRERPWRPAGVLVHNGVSLGVGHAHMWRAQRFPPVWNEHLHVLRPPQTLPLSTLTTDLPCPVFTTSYLVYHIYKTIIF